ncbi:MAG: PAS domain S-box protein [Desulfosalsimonas sp.]|uniref:sensor domain-containing diguanylate cyclase/phosphohydrolase n=1 Tax=Desulfosalsimonas sp. TaxID=3073848 RepID=UPI00397091E9
MNHKSQDPSQSTDVLREKQRRLQIVEAQIQAVFNNALFGIIFVDEHGTITFANQRMAEMLGWDLEELVGSAYLDHISEQELQEAEQKTFQLIRGEIDHVTTECQYRRKNGTIFWGKLEAAQINYPEGFSIGLAGIISDVTAQKEAEQKLQSAYDKLDKLVELNSDGIMVIDLEGTILFINPAAAHMLGRTEAELLGKQFGYPLTPGESTEIELLAGNGTVKVAELRASQTEWDGKTAILTSFRDITERKEAEENLRRMGFRDSLSGLYNRNFFEEEMNRLQDGRYSPIGIIICDVDGIKFINDTLGHQSGDEILISIANLLKNNFRVSDIISRIGGDEFAILLAGVDQDVAEKLVRRLRQGIKDHNKTNPGLPISLSIGYAVSKQRPVDMQALFRAADDRMYRDKLQREKSSRSAPVQALTKAMEARDFITEGHSERLKELAASLAHSIDLGEDTINDLLLLSKFHDLGKVGIPDRILFKPGPLTGQEMEEMQKHSEIGHRIARSVPDLAPIAKWILWHHERWDGQGYPQGLQGENIPLLCRILAIVDAYDAMTRDRPYRKAMTRDEAIEQLRLCAGTQFDPNLVEKFIMIEHEADRK